MTADITLRDMRALRYIDQKMRYSSGPRSPLSVESIHPVAAANCARKGLLNSYRQSETCKPNRKRYFRTYNLTLTGSKAIANADGT